MMTITAVLISMLAATAAQTVPAPDQSLADLARYERARKKQVTSKINIDSDKIRRESMSVPAAATLPPSVTGGTPATPDAAGGAPVKDEKYWRKTFEDARTDVRRAEDKVKLTELRLADLNTQLLTRSDVYGREQTLQPEIARTQTELDNARKDVERLKQKITELEVELRRSGGLPGWAR